MAIDLEALFARAFDNELKKRNMTGFDPNSATPSGPMVDTPTGPQSFVPPMQSQPDIALNTTALDTLSQVNKGDITDRQATRKFGTTPTGIGDVALDRLINPALDKIGLGGVGKFLNKGADIIGDITKSARGAAERGTLGAIAPNFQAGVADAANRRLQEAMLAAKTATAASNPISQIPAATLANFDPQSVVNAVQSGDLSQLKVIGPQPQDFTKQLNDLGDDIRAESKTFEQAATAQRKIEAAATNPSPAGDLALIFNYMKVLDPGSTVREGEFANAQNSGSVPQRVRALYNSIIDGTRLTETQRLDFLNQSRGLFNAEAERQRERNQRFRTRGVNMGIPDALLEPILIPAEALEVTQSPSQDDQQTSPPAPVADDEEPEGEI